ncbi:MAG: hypothetical protein GY930_22665 [bacterium]|nr:hypothetical protein [bacterium]
MNFIVFVYIAIGITLAFLAMLLYMRSVASRQQHVCPVCGERQTVELMDAKRCSQCGAPFAND